MSEISVQFSLHKRDTQTLDNRNLALRHTRNSVISSDVIINKISFNYKKSTMVHSVA